MFGSGSRGTSGPSSFKHLKPPEEGQKGFLSFRQLVDDGLAFKHLKVLYPSHFQI